jgi:uncharacterized membrane protein YdbT with pleckstrin-like domain
MENTFENGAYYAPGSKVLSFFIINRSLPLVVVFALLAIGASVLESVVAKSSMLVGVLPFPATAITQYGLPIVIGLGVLLVLITTVSAWTEYKSVKFMFDDFAFHIQRGIFSKNEIAIPYRQVQNVSHTQSMNERMWGIAHVVVETAGTDEKGSAAQSDGILPVLDTDLAISLQAELLKRASVK